MYRFVEKMALESADTISDIHGGGSPEAHRVTIYRGDGRREQKARGQKAGGHHHVRGQALKAGRRQSGTMRTYGAPYLSAKYPVPSP